VDAVVVKASVPPLLFRNLPPASTIDKSLDDGPTDAAMLMGAG
jgi:hypothetical protein